MYWKPVWNALEGKWGLHLCNPRHVRVIPEPMGGVREVGQLELPVSRELRKRRQATEWALRERAIPGCAVAFCQMAWAATRKQRSYFKAQYRRLAGRRGPQPARKGLLKHRRNAQLTFV